MFLLDMSGRSAFTSDYSSQLAAVIVYMSPQKTFLVRTDLPYDWTLYSCDSS